MTQSKTSPRGIIELPAPRLEGKISLEATLARRRSLREFSARSLTDAELSQLLWATQGVTNDEGDRTAPSAGAMRPLEVYLASANGLFHYRPDPHHLRRRSESDFRSTLYRLGLEQVALLEAPAVFLIAAVFGRTIARYGRTFSPPYVYMEVGHAAQNLLLQAVALDLGAVVIGAFEDEEVQIELSLPRGHRPLYLVPVGEPR